MTPPPPREVTPAERAKLEKYCTFFELSLPHLLGEEQPRIDKAARIIATMLGKGSKPETVIDHCAANIAQFKTDKSTWLKCGARDKRLWYSRPESLRRTIDASALALAEAAATPARLEKMALIHPGIFTTTATTLQHNIYTTADHFESYGLTRCNYFLVVENHPTLSNCRPENIIPKIACLVAAEQAGVLQYPIGIDGQPGTIADYLLRYSVNLAANISVLERGIALATRSRAMHGVPVKRIYTPIRNQDALEAALDRGPQPTGTRRPYATAAKTAKPPAASPTPQIWHLIENEVGQHLLQFGSGQEKPITVRAAALLRALAKGPLTTNNRGEHDVLRDLNDNLVILTVSRLKETAATLEPDRPLLTGQYSKGDLRLVDSTQLVIEKRNLPPVPA